VITLHGRQQAIPKTTRRLAEVRRSKSEGRKNAEGRGPKGTFILFSKSITDCAGGLQDPCGKYTDGQHVISDFGSCGVVADSVDGKELWSYAMPGAKTRTGANGQSWGGFASLDRVNAVTSRRPIHSFPPQPRGPCGPIRKPVWQSLRLCRSRLRGRARCT